MRHKILLLEDDPDIRFAVALMLESAGYEVKQLSSGAAVINHTIELPDLFLLDKRMPDMDGLDVCRHLRSRDESKDIPIIIISASPKFGPLALNAGASDFLEKPFQMKKLLALVAKYLMPDGQSKI